MRRAVGLAATAALALAVPLWFTSSYAMGLADQVLIFVVLAAGYNLLLGFAGQVSLGHIALFAIGAYASALLSLDFGWPFLAALAGAGAASGLAGAVVGIPALRVRSHYLTLLTLAFSEVVRLLIRNLDSVTNGSNGLSGIPRMDLFGVVLRRPWEVYLFLLAVAACAVLGIRQLDRSRFGRAFKAVRDAEIGAEVCGVNVAAIKVTAFVVSAVYAGIAGSLYAHTLRFISPDFFSLGLTISLLAMVLVGGQGTVVGPVIGAVLLTLAPELLRFVREYYLILFGVGIWAVTLYLPAGIAGFADRLRPRRP